MNLQADELPIKRFGFRLSPRDPEERLLSQLMAEDLERNDVNLSAVVKRLLMAWYQQRMATGEMPSPGTLMGFHPMNGNGHKPTPIVEEEESEDPEDKLVMRLANISFDSI